MSELTILCPLCGTANQGGKFCVICGAKLEGVEPVAPVAAEPAPIVEEPVAAPIPAPVVEEPAFFAEPAPAPVAVAEKPQKAKKPVVGIIFTLVIFLLLAAFTTLVLLDDMKLRDTVEEKDAAIAEKEKSVAVQEEKIEELATRKLQLSVMQLTESQGDPSFVVHFTPASDASSRDGGLSGV